MNEPSKGFITYSHQNTESKNKLRDHLAVMEQNSELITWDDGQLTPGDKALQEDILEKVADSDLLLYLVSAASLDSKNCNRELAEALQEELQVIPIILEHCDWLHHHISNFEVLPEKGKPISKWEDESEGWQNVVQGIRKVVHKMQSQANSTRKTSDKSNLAARVFQRGNFLMIIGQIDMAITAYSDVIELDQRHAVAYCNRGSAYGAKGKPDRAIEDFDKAIQFNPSDAMAYNNRGSAFRETGNIDHAIEDHVKAIKLKPDYAEAYMKRGVAYHKKGDIDLAIKDFNKAVRLDPNDDLTYYNRGNVYRDKGASDIAIANYTQAIELNPNLAEAYNIRGIVYKETSNIDRAIEDYIRAIELKPDYAEAYYNRGLAYEKKDELDTAIKDFNKAIEFKSDYAEAFTARGMAYGKKGDIDSAIVDLDIAIQLKPGLVEAYINRGTAWGYKGELDTAIKDYTEAIRLKLDHADAYSNRGAAYYAKGEIDSAIRDFTKAIKLNPEFAGAYNNRGTAYLRKGELEKAISDYTEAIKLKPDLAEAYYNRAVTWLHLKEWEKTKVDLHTAKKMGMDIFAAFCNNYKNVETYEKRHRVKLPEDIALLLTERRRTRYPKTRAFLDAEGNPIESPNVVNLREQLRHAGIPLGEYIKEKPAFGINTALIEVFVVDKTVLDKLIASHHSSVDILKPFLQRRDLKRWHVDKPQQWLIFTYRGIEINTYPAILKYLEKHKEPLSKRKGKQEWYELPASLKDAERFAQPKLVCPNTYNHQTFAVDTAGYYYGNTSYLIPTEETWLCGLLNSRTVEWFYSQESDQLTGAELKARSGYIQKIPIPEIAESHKDLIGKFVDYLIYLQQQPTINSNDLAHARDRIMFGYFERIVDALVYEVYLTEDLYKGNKYFFQPLLDEHLPSHEEIQGDKINVLRDIFELLYERTHLVRRNLYYLDSVKPVRIIEGKL